MNKKVSCINLCDFRVLSTFAPEALLHSYKRSFNGFVVRLTEEEAQKISGIYDYSNVFKFLAFQTVTTQTHY